MPCALSESSAASSLGCCAPSHAPPPETRATRPTRMQTLMTRIDSDRPPAPRLTPHATLPGPPGLSESGAGARTLRRAAPSQHSPPERLESRSATDSRLVRPAGPRSPPWASAAARPPHASRTALPAPRGPRPRAPGPNFTEPRHAQGRNLPTSRPFPAGSRGMRYRAPDLWFRWDGGSGLGRGWARAEWGRSLLPGARRAPGARRELRVSGSRTRGSARLQQQPAQAGRLLRGPRARVPLPVGHRHHAQPCPPQQPPLEQRRPVGPPPAAWQPHKVRWPVHLREAERWEGRTRGGERGEGVE